MEGERELRGSVKEVKVNMQQSLDNNMIKHVSARFVSYIHA